MISMGSGRMYYFGTSNMGSDDPRWEEDESWDTDEEDDEV